VRSLAAEGPRSCRPAISCCARSHQLPQGHPGRAAADALTSHTSQGRRWARPARGHAQGRAPATGEPGGPCLVTNCRGAAERDRRWVVQPGDRRAQADPTSTALHATRFSTPGDAPWASPALPAPHTQQDLTTPLRTSHSKAWLLHSLPALPGLTSHGVWPTPSSIPFPHAAASPSHNRALLTPHPARRPLQPHACRCIAPCARRSAPAPCPTLQPLSPCLARRARWPAPMSPRHAYTTKPLPWAPRA
jgi:hypothetical protein